MGSRRVRPLRQRRGGDRRRPADVRRRHADPRRDRGRARRRESVMADHRVLYVDRTPARRGSPSSSPRAARCAGRSRRRWRTRSGSSPAGVRWDGARFDLMPRARVLSRSGIGYDSVDVAAATARGIVVCVAADAPDRLDGRARRRPDPRRRQAPGAQPTPPPGRHRRLLRRQRGHRAGRAHARARRVRPDRPAGRSRRGGVGDGGRRLRPVRLGGRRRRRRAGPVRRAAPAAPT